jgi:hypothetical protein
MSLFTQRTHARPPAAGPRYPGRRRCARAAWIGAGLAVLGLLAGGACGRRNADARIAQSPKEAASQLETAFAAADAEAKAAAEAASQALRNAEYERAMVSLQTIRARENVTLEQGIAVQSSIVNLETSLVKAMDAGDPEARRIYTLLKELKRD